MIRALPILCVIVALPETAHALPRFAARTGAECTLCHVSPSGGGARNRYGSNIYQTTMLPVLWDSVDDENEEGDELVSAFSGAVTDWLSIGGDLRLVYLYAKPEAAPVGREPETTSTFFLMQADLYTTAQFGPHVATVFDVGIYSGFEAWLLFKAAEEPSDFNFYIKAGHFLPAFGIREVNHELYTRAGVGFNTTDRDTGIEATAFAGPFSLSLGLVNGTFDETIFDTRGSRSRSFEKAFVSRASVRFSIFDVLRAQIGGSFYVNDNVDATNPLFAGFLPANGEALSMEGLDETRLGAFVLAGLGRFVYMGEFVYVRDQFSAPGGGRLRGYASAQELDLLLTQGLELGGIVEFMDPDLELSGNSTLRLSLFTEIFVHTFVDVRVMFRATRSEVPSLGDANEVIAFAHSFF